jgi:hypothetical protein
MYRGVLVVALGSSVVLAGCAASSKIAGSNPVTTPITSSTVAPTTTLAPTTTVTIPPTTSTTQLVVILSSPADDSYALDQQMIALLGRRPTDGEVAEFSSYVDRYETQQQEAAASGEPSSFTGVDSLAYEWVEQNYHDEITGRNVAHAMNGISCFISHPAGYDCSSTSTSTEP